MRKTDGAMPPVTEQDNGTVTTLAKQHQAVGGRHQSIGPADLAPFRTRQDAPPMDLLQKGDVTKPQHSRNLSPCGQRVVSYKIDVETLPRRHEVRNAKSLQRREATHAPPVGQNLQSKCIIQTHTSIRNQQSVGVGPSSVPLGGVWDSAGVSSATASDPSATSGLALACLRNFFSSFFFFLASSRLRF